MYITRIVRLPAELINNEITGEIDSVIRGTNRQGSLASEPPRY
jgi:hypothetical protein